jgi:CheY-like chemotaxis protein
VTKVLVVEIDDALRGTVHDILDTAGDAYEVTEVGTEAEALTYLTTQPTAEGVVVVCSNKHIDHHLHAAFFASVVADKRLARRHRYILLSSSPARIPAEMRAHLTQLNVRVLAKPFDMDVLLAAVSEAAAQLAAARSPLWRRWRRTSSGS